MSGIAGDQRALGAGRTGVDEDERAALGRRGPEEANSVVDAIAVDGIEDGDLLDLFALPEGRAGDPAPIDTTLEARPLGPRDRDTLPVRASPLHPRTHPEDGAPVKVLVEIARPARPGRSAINLLVGAERHHHVNHQRFARRDRRAHGTGRVRARDPRSERRDEGHGQAGEARARGGHGGPWALIARERPSVTNMPLTPPGAAMRVGDERARNRSPPQATSGSTPDTIVPESNGSPITHQPRTRNVLRR